MNKHGSPRGGYTIVEALIFLAVTTALFISAAALISGQQGRTEFTQSVRDFESQMTDLANNVSSGYYAKTKDFTCIDNGTGKPKISSAANPQGTNKGCIFVGVVIQVAPAGNDSQYKVYTAAGLKLNSTGTDVQDLGETQPVLIYPPSSGSSVPDLSTDYTLGNGVTFVSLNYGNPPQSIGTFGFFTTFGTLGGGNKTAGTIYTNLIPVTHTLFADTPTVLVASKFKVGNLTTTNPPGGVSICLKSNGSNQSALLTYGENNRSLTSDLKFFNSGNCT